MQIAFVSTGSAEDAPGKAAVALLVMEGAEADAADAAPPGPVADAVRRGVQRGGFKGAKGKTMDLFAVAEGGPERVLLVGGGPQGKLDDAGIEAAAAAAYAALKTSGAETLTLWFRLGEASGAARAALAVRLAAYRFDRYRTKEKPETRPTIQSLRVVVQDVAAAEAAYAPLSALADGVVFARDLASEPANVLYPAEFARRVQALQPLGLKVEILGEAAMSQLGMAALVAVGQGSRRESQLAVIQWTGADDPSAQPIAFVGKGVCFDSGGISIKPAEGMEDMKWDMGGAAAVAGLMQTLATRKARANVVGILGLVENMPDGNAQRPGDVVTSMSGQTIEVINTDAEGRLVLADALWYCQERFKPRFMVDLATLTGAVIISLGNDVSGLFSNDDDLAGKLAAAGAVEGEALWRMPLPPAYEKQIDSPIADVKNVGGRAAGSITAALFLQRFVNGLPWAHLDIAGTIWRKSGQPTVPEGASGFGVRLLNRLVQDHFEG